MKHTQNAELITSDGLHSYWLCKQCNGVFTNVIVRIGLGSRTRSPRRNDEVSSVRNARECNCYRQPILPKTPADNQDRTELGQNWVADLKVLSQLRESGSLTEEEFNTAKAKLLTSRNSSAVPPNVQSSEENSFRVGDRILDRQFGVGTVTSLHVEPGKPDDLQITVEFDIEGTKTTSLAHVQAQLRKLPN